MKRPVPALAAIVLLLISLSGCGPSGDKAERVPQADPAPAPAAAGISGRLEDGLRVLTFDPAAQDQRFRVYRGDYVRPELAGGGAFTLEIPALDLRLVIPAPEGAKPFFKMEEAGSFPFRIGMAGGVIEAAEFQAANYREVTSGQAFDLIAELHPVILDVRTPPEFAEGHLENAVLIPVQELQRRLGELAVHKEDPVLVYCRTGNRSTVAAKLLIDSGFTRVLNLRRGIVQWSGEGLPVTR